MRAQNLPDDYDLKYIEKDYKRKKDQLSVVSQRVSALIVAKHPSYAAELAKVAELQEALKRAVSTCGRMRRCSLVSSLDSHSLAAARCNHISVQPRHHACGYCIVDDARNAASKSAKCSAH